MLKLNAKELRTTAADPAAAAAVKKHPLTIILDNVLDTYNVGSVFRLADAVAAERVILCGGTLTPPNSRIKKASINTTGWVSWDYEKSALDAVKQRKAKGDTIVSVEQDPRSVPFKDAVYRLPVTVVVGNETSGINREILDISDRIVELPMWGVNKSLNVMVSLGIVLYEIAKKF